MPVVGMGIRVYVKRAIGGTGESEEPDEQAEEGRSSGPGEFIRRSIVEGENRNRQSERSTEGSEREG